MSLDTDINYFQSNEFIVGENHPSLDDTMNRPLKSVIQKFDEGADTQVTRNVIKIDSATDIEVGVVSDDVVSYNKTTQKFEKAIDSKILGIIDIENLFIVTSGMQILKYKNDMIIGVDYYLDGTQAGAITDVYDSGVFIGKAFGNNKILNSTLANSGVTTGESGIIPVIEIGLY